MVVKIIHGMYVCVLYTQQIMHFFCHIANLALPPTIRQQSHLSIIIIVKSVHAKYTKHLLPYKDKLIISTYGEFIQSRSILNKYTHLSTKKCKEDVLLSANFPHIHYVHGSQYPLKYAD